jgi:hypothetical protein
LQLTTPDQIGAPASDTTIVSDVPAPASRPAPGMPTTPSRSEETKPEAGNTRHAEQAPTRAESSRRQVPATKLPAPAKRESAAEKTSAMAEPFPAAPPAPAVTAAPAFAPAVTSVSAPAPAPAPTSQPSAQRAQESVAAQPVPLGKMAAGRAADARGDEARAKDRGPLPVAEWIALIRRLRDEGKSADAVKELAAFRVAHADHEKLLPADLRDWRP